MCQAGACFEGPGANTLAMSLANMPDASAVDDLARFVRQREQDLAEHFGPL